MTQREAFDWVDVAFATTALGVESANVVWLRTLNASRGGPKAANEAWRMVSEKIASLAELQARFLAGSMGNTPSATARATVKHYRRKVAANRRRLGKGRM